MATLTIDELKDIYLIRDLRRNKGAIEGVQVIRQDIYNLIVNNDLFYDETYGYDLIGKLQTSPINQYHVIASELESKIYQNEYINQVTVNIDPPDSNATVKIYINATVIETAETITLTGFISTIDSTAFTFI